MLYLDSSALVKLVVSEPETAALRRYLRTRSAPVTSALSVAEVLRAALRRDAEHVGTATRVLARVDRIARDRQFVESAGTLLPEDKRTLDALHIATALELGDGLEAVVAHDRRLLDAAIAHRLPTASPG